MNRDDTSCLTLIAFSIIDSSKFRSFSFMSTNTGTAPLKTNAFAVETNVYDGRMISYLVVSLVTMLPFQVQLYMSELMRHFCM